MVAGVAQLVAQRIRNAKVGSSNLFSGTTRIPGKKPMQVIAWAFCYVRTKDKAQILRSGLRLCHYGCVGFAVAGLACVVVDAASSLALISLESLAKIAPANEFALTPLAENEPFS